MQRKKILSHHVDLVDINKRAIHLANMNILNNKVEAKAWESDVYDNVDGKYDLIISNPPIRAGKEVLYKFLKGGLAKLNKKGELWFVISKDKGAKTVLKELEKLGNCQKIDQSKGFWVICCKN